MLEKCQKCSEMAQNIKIVLKSCSKKRKIFAKISLICTLLMSVSYNLIILHKNVCQNKYQSIRNSYSRVPFHDKSLCTRPLIFIVTKYGLLVMIFAVSPAYRAIRVSPTHVIVPHRCFSTNKNLYLTFPILQTLRLSRHTLLKFTTGRVFDLVSNDVKRMEEETIMWFFGFPFAILETVVVMILLVYFIGWQAVMAVIFLCLLAVYFACLSYASAALRLRTATVSDRRISLMNQVVCGIRAIKTHAWEDEYREKVKHIRR